MARGIERRNIFTDDRDRSVFLDRLGDLALETETPVYAWCLVPDHFHLLLRSGGRSLSAVCAEAFPLGSSFGDHMEGASGERSGTQLEQLDRFS
jgi:hypothetical protein